jgi:hypothetical protein
MMRTVLEEPRTSPHALRSLLSRTDHAALDDCVEHSEI